MIPVGITRSERVKKVNILDLTEHNANHIIPSYCICQLVAEVWLTGMAPLGALNHRFDFLLLVVMTIAMPRCMNRCNPLTEIVGLRLLCL